MNLIGTQVLHLQERPDWRAECLRSLEGQKCDTYLQPGIDGNTNAARLRGFDALPNPWLSFADPDDIVEPRAFELLEEAIRANPNASIVFSDEVCINPDNIKIGEGLHFGADVTAEMIREHPRSCHHLVVWRRDVLERARYIIEADRYGVEWTLSFTATTMGQVLKVKKPLYRWRKHDMQTHKVRKPAHNFHRLKTELYGFFEVNEP